MKCKRVNEMKRFPSLFVDIKRWQWLDKWRGEKGQARRSAQAWMLFWIESM